MEPDIRHGRDGWSLAEYDWDPRTGTARVTYERPLGFNVVEDDGEGGVMSVPAVDVAYGIIRQPARRGHSGWRRWNGKVERDWDSTSTDLD
jgi:hypothetical protein